MIQRAILASFLILTSWPAFPAPGDTPGGPPALNWVAGLSLDLYTGNVYVDDEGSSMIFRVGPHGTAIPVAGTGSAGFNGDGQGAIQTQFNHPMAISFDQRLNELFVADTKNYRVRSISFRDYKVRTVAGKGTTTPAKQLPFDPHAVGSIAAGKYSGDGGPAVDAELNLPSGVCADPIGILFIADSGNHRIRAVNRGNSPVIVMGVDVNPDEIRTIAGTGTMGFSGDGGKATQAQLAFPTEMRVDATGSLIFVDSFNQRIRKVDRQSGLIHTIAEGSIDVPAERALLQWATSVVGLGVTMDQQIIYSNRVDHSLHRITRAGENQVILTLQPHEAEFGSVDIGPENEVYVADVHWDRVILLDGSRGKTYFGSSPRPVISFPGKKVASGGRTE